MSPCPLGLSLLLFVVCFSIRLKDIADWCYELVWIFIRFFVLLYPFCLLSPASDHVSSQLPVQSIELQTNIDLRNDRIAFFTAISCIIIFRSMMCLWLAWVQASVSVALWFSFLEKKNNKKKQGLTHLHRYWHFWRRKHKHLKKRKTLSDWNPG